MTFEPEMLESQITDSKHLN